MQVTQVIGTTSRPLAVLGAGRTEPRVASTSQPVAADPPKKCAECHGTSECQDCAPKGSGMNGDRVCGRCDGSGECQHCKGWISI